MPIGQYITIKHPDSLIKAIHRYKLVVLDADLPDAGKESSKGYVDDTNVYLFLISSRSAKTPLASSRSWRNARNAHIKLGNLRELAPYLRIHSNANKSTKNLIPFLIAVAKTNIMEK